MKFAPACAILVNLWKRPHDAKQVKKPDAPSPTLFRLRMFLSARVCSDQKTALYVGRTNVPETGGIFGLPQEDEDIRIHVLSTAEALNLLYSKKVRDAITTITLQWFALHHTELRSRWLVSEASTPLI